MVVRAARGSQRIIGWATRLAIVACVVGMSGCATWHPPSPVWMTPNRIVVKREALPLPEHIRASFGLGQRPEVIQAYRRFLKKGQAPNITHGGFETLAYSPYTQPIVLCAPLHLCVVQLEAGEHIRTIHLGDAARWGVSVTKVGDEAGSAQVVVKPRRLKTATDMVISTDHRLYTIGLVSQPGARTHVVSFYYPQAVWHNPHAPASTLFAKTGRQHHQTNLPISDAPQVHLNHLNFRYTIRGRAPWRPLRVFDDGQHTFIQMPKPIREKDLPVLYVTRAKQTHLVNYHYRRPYYRIQGLFDNAMLISGQGAWVKRVVIHRQRRRSRRW